MFLLLLPEAHIENVLPIGESGFKAILKASLSVAGISAFPSIVLLSIYPKHVQTAGSYVKPFLSSSVAAGLVMLVVTWASIAVLGANFTEKLSFPVYMLAKQINIGRFFERVESIVAALWFFSIFFKLCLYFESFAYSLASLLRFQEHRLLALPLGILIFIYSQICYPNTAYAREWDTTSFLPYIFILGVTIPGLLLIMDMARNKTPKDRSPQS
jgi:spore germination protein KB